MSTQLYRAEVYDTIQKKYDAILDSIRQNPTQDASRKINVFVKSLPKTNEFAPAIKTLVKNLVKLNYLIKTNDPELELALQFNHEIELDTGEIYRNIPMPYTKKPKAAASRSREQSPSTIVVPFPTGDVETSVPPPKVAKALRLKSKVPKPKRQAPAPPLPQPAQLRVASHGDAKLVKSKPAQLVKQKPFDWSTKTYRELQQIAKDLELKPRNGKKEALIDLILKDTHPVNY
jgi:hypothetical protein